MSSAEAFLQTHDFLLSQRLDFEAACREFTWPQLGDFNRPGGCLRQVGEEGTARRGFLLDVNEGHEADSRMPAPVAA
ncbi:MAG: hypothetical protein JNJ89_06035 [Rubrivivax sp.]|nr:hypothetical protein [Rubrivivax sp.]